MYNIIITGGLGTGKSSVVNILQKQHYLVLSADSIISDIYNENIFTDQIANIFSLKSSEVSKKNISKMAFQSKSRLAQLEQLLYPELKKRVEEYKRLYAKQNSLYLFYEAPVFFEKNKVKDYDCALVVSAKKHICASRLLLKGISNIKFDKIMNQQMPIKKKELLADYVIVNNSNLEDLEKKVKAFLYFLKDRYEN